MSRLTASDFDDWRESWDLNHSTNLICRQCKKSYDGHSASCYCSKECKRSYYALLHRTAYKQARRDRRARARAQ